MRMWRFFLLFAIGFFSFSALANTTNSTNAPPQKMSITQKLMDPEDGHFDLSQWLGTAKGFLPVPIFITEPAVGLGGGLALVFFHDSLKNRAEQAKEKNSDGTPKRVSPPSMTGVAGFATENGTWGGGLFHLGIWNDDSIRYLGALAYASINYDYYGLLNHPRPITVDGLFLLQQVTFRLGESDFFAGVNYKFISTTAQGNSGISLPPPAGNGLEVQSGGASAIIEYDSRDNIFTPNRGLSSKAEWTHFDGWLGSDNTFEQLSFKNRFWHPLTKNLILGVRGDLSSTTGDAPFYMLPFIQIRGIPAMRYQGEHVLTTEVEVRWDVTPRWSLIGFAGAGWATRNDFNDLFRADTHPAGGLGFRYLTARLFNLRSGIDIAFSEEDSTIYFVTGTAWGR